MKKYSWKGAFGIAKFDPELAAKTFKEVENKYGKLTPENLLDYAKNPKTSIHKLFEWDDTEAANKWRKHQARLIINNLEITIISDGEKKEIGAYEIIYTNQEPEYKFVEDLSTSEIEYIKDTTLKTLSQLSKKLKTYNEFDNIVFKIEKAINELTKIEV